MRRGGNLFGFCNARIWKETEEECGTRNLFAEVLWEEGKLRINILTHTNEFSVLAEDVELEWEEEDFRSINGQIEYLPAECVRQRKKGK